MSLWKYRVRGLGVAIPVSALAALLIIAALAQRGGTASAGAPTPRLGVPVANALSKIDAAVLQDTANGKSASFIVLMSERPDLTAAYGMKDHDARGWYVFNTLRSHAVRSQAGLRAWLDARGVAYNSFWIANALAISGDRALVESIAARTDVRKLESNRPFQGISPLPPSDGQPNIPQAIEWGVQRVNAPQLWAMGYRGQGITVGNQDTGMRWTHQAIKNQYKGWNGTTANHNYNWWDGVRFPITTTGNICGYSVTEPCDDDELLGGGHGTHTTGTAVGWDGASNQIGVAPDAKWIGCRNLERGVGLPVTYLECFEFFLAPHDLNGANPDPTKRPHVMNNSWACVEGCAGDILRDAVESSQAAGIFVEVSAGNEGPACSTIAWEPQIFEASFDTGAIDISNNLAEFSSRGPVARDGSLRLKPNISAPGVDVRSSLRGSDTEYGELSGTSMAGPHVVGVVALLWSARPDLVRVITPTKILLERSANPAVNVPEPPPICGTTTTTQIPNNFFGWGRVDALAALARAQATVTPGPTVTEMPTFTPGTPPTGTPLPTLSTATGTATVVVGTGTPTLTAIVTGTATLTSIATGTSVVTGTATTTAVVTSIATGTPLATGTVVTGTATLTALPSPGTPATTATGTVTPIVPTLTIAVPTSTRTATVVVTGTIATATHTVTVAVPSVTMTASTATRTVTVVVPTLTRTVTVVAPSVTRTVTVSPPTITGSPTLAVTGTPTMPPTVIASSTVAPPTVTTAVPTNTTGVPSPSITPVPPTVVPTGTSTVEATQTGIATIAQPTDTATATSATSTSVPPTNCPLQFIDVPPGSTFYTYIRCLVCRYIISGYNDHTFRPQNNITRGQIAKMVSNSAGINDDPGEQIYEDVNNTNPFYVWINRLSRRGYVGGYPCGMVTGEPCGGLNLPYFRPSTDATRGQLSKIVATAAQFNEPVSGQFFADVEEDNPFYVWIQRLATRNIMGGYPCGGVNPQTGQPEPCDPENRPYFRWANEVTRGQASKIVAGAFFPNCETANQQ